MTGDSYKRRMVSADAMQCGCRWGRVEGIGDVLRECPIHKAATAASVRKFDRERNAPPQTVADREGER